MVAGKSDVSIDSHVLQTIIKHLLLGTVCLVLRDDEDGSDSSIACRLSKSCAVGAADIFKIMGGCL